MVVAGCTMSLTALLEVLFARNLGYDAVLMGAFMLTSGLGVILVDVLGTRFVPALDARRCLTVALGVFGLACITMAFAPPGLMLAARMVQGFAGGLMLGGGLQAAIRVRPDDEARALGRFNAAFLFGAAVGSSGGLLVAAGVSGLPGYRIAFTSGGVMAVLVALLLHLTLPQLRAEGWQRPRFGLPRLAKNAGGARILAIAMTGDFVRGGVLFTALPLVGAVRGYSTLAIGGVIAVISVFEIVLLVVAHRIVALVGVARAVGSALVLGCLGATVLALVEGCRRTSWPPASSASHLPVRRSACRSWWSGPSASRPPAWPGSGSRPDRDDGRLGRLCGGGHRRRTAGAVLGDRRGPGGQHAPDPARGPVGGNWRKPSDS